jgi:glycosyltransferase involved in cell wall biosynthesis
MKVLILVEGAPRTPLPGGVGWGGFARYWVGAVEELRAQGLEPVFVSLRESSPLSDQIETMGVRTLSLGSRSRADLMVQIKRMRSLIKEERADIVHGNESVQGAVAAIAGKGLKGVRNVFHRHHVRAPKAQKRFSRTATRLSDMTVAVSHAAAEAAEREDGCPKSQLRVVHNGIPEPRPVSAQEIEDARRSLGIPQGDLILTLVGHLRPEKGHHVRLEAMRNLDPKPNSRVHAVVVGGGSGEVALRHGLSGLEDRVHLLGHRDNVQLWNAVADICVVPSLDEPFGLVALEAMAAGRPVVASRVGGLSEVVRHGETGLLVEPGNPKVLAGAIEKLQTGADLRRRLGEAGRTAFLKSFTQRRMVEGWVRAYQEAQEIA